MEGLFSQPNFYLNIIQEILNSLKEEKPTIDLLKQFKISELHRAAIMFRDLDPKYQPIKNKVSKAIKRLLSNSKGYKSTREEFKKALIALYNLDKKLNADVINDTATLISTAKPKKDEGEANYWEDTERINTSLKVSVYNWRDALKFAAKKKKKNLGELEKKLQGKKDKGLSGALNLSEKPQKEETSLPKKEKPKKEIKEVEPEVEKLDLEIEEPEVSEKPDQVEEKSESSDKYGEFKEYVDKLNPNRAAIKKILKEKSWEDLLDIALDSSAPPEVKGEIIPALFERPENDILQFSKSDKLDSDTLRALYNQASNYERNWRVRKAVAEHKNAPREVVLKAAQDSDYRVRLGAAGSPELDDPEIIKKLVKDPNAEVREELIRNPHTSEKFIAKLYDRIRSQRGVQSYEDKVILLSQHKNLSGEQLLELLIDAAEDLKLDKKLKWKDPKLRSVRKDSIPLQIVINIASNSGLDPRVYAMLGTSIRPEIKMAVANNEASPKHLLETLTKDPDLGVSSAAKQTLEKIT